MKQYKSLTDIDDKYGVESTLQRLISTYVRTYFVYFTSID